MFKPLLAIALGWQMLRAPLSTIKKFQQTFTNGRIVLRRVKNVKEHSLSFKGTKKDFFNIQHQGNIQPSTYLNVCDRYLLHSPVVRREFSLSSEHMLGLPFRGQGLVKNTEIIKSPRMERFLKKRHQEQEWGRKFFPIFPDILFYSRCMIIATSCFFMGWIFYPNYSELKHPSPDPTLVEDFAMEVKRDGGLMTRLYLSLPLRIISRAWGRLHSEATIPVFLRPYLLGFFSWATDVNMEEAVDSDFKSYENLSQFFRRPIKSSLRPIDTVSDVVSPCDGKILYLGEVVDGAVEQVKGVTYSLQKFLGPLSQEPKHDEWGRNSNYNYNWSRISLPQYTKALMHDPEHNNLYHCIIYLAPGDYHRFHSPTDWVIKHRRHFPGDLLSVNPKIASLIPNLFVLNERVVLSGEWKHGFFSMTAVGATNVGSVEIYGDESLNTNRTKRLYGAYYDERYGNIMVKRGVRIGEFNLGSTIVLVFEAPKNFSYCIAPNEKVLYGKALEQ